MNYLVHTDFFLAEARRSSDPESSNGLLAPTTVEIEAPSATSLCPPVRPPMQADAACHAAPALEAGGQLQAGESKLRFTKLGVDGEELGAVRHHR